MIGAGGDGALARCNEKRLSQRRAHFHRFTKDANSENNGAGSDNSNQTGPAWMKQATRMPASEIKREVS
jgi:hypothetical protein